MNLYTYCPKEKNLFTIGKLFLLQEDLSFSYKKITLLNGRIFLFIMKNFFCLQKELSSFNKEMCVLTTRKFLLGIRRFLLDSRI